MKVIVITGPTATGKTALAVRIAREFSGEIVSADCRQIYRGMDIGSGKDLSEYSAGGTPVPHHLIDLLSPASPEQYTLADFMRDAKAAIRDIASRGKVPVLCGGTGLYLTALIRGYLLPGGPADRTLREKLKQLPLSELLSPESERTNGEETNRYRLSRKAEIRESSTLSASSGGPLEGAEYLVIGAFRPREEVRKRIELRLDERFRAGMCEEVKRLHEEQGVSWERLAAFGLEYGMIARHLQGELSFPEMREALLTGIRRFAKRQDTWFRKMEKEGIPIHWISPSETEKVTALCARFLKGETIPPPEQGLARNSR